MAVAQEPREPLVEADVVRTMPELVEHRVGPVAVVGNVREHADVALAVDVDAERVLALAVAREEVAAVEDGIRVDAEAVVRGTRERHDVLAREHVREVDPTGRRHLLEEGVLVVPGPQLADRAAELLREPCVGRRLPAGERIGGQPVALVERLEEPRLVHLRGVDGQREPVAVAERPSRLVAEPRELPHVVRHRGAHGLRRLPRLTPLCDVVALAQDSLDLVVVDRPAGDLAAVLREAGLDRRLELDDPVPERLRDLLRHEAGVEQVELAANERLGPVGPGRRDVAEEVGVGERIGERELAATRRCSFSSVAETFASTRTHAALYRGRSRSTARSTTASVRSRARRDTDERRRETTIRLVGTDAHRAAAAELPDRRGRDHGQRQPHAGRRHQRALTARTVRSVVVVSGDGGAEDATWRLNPSRCVWQVVRLELCTRWSWKAARGL